MLAYRQQCKRCPAPGLRGVKYKSKGNQLGDAIEYYKDLKELRKEEREQKAKVNKEQLAQMGIAATEQSKNVFRIDTAFGAVMYYPPSNKWQHRGKTHRGDVKSFHGWLKNQGYIQ